MFIAKLKLYHNDCPIVNRCVRFKADVLSYPGHHYSKGGRNYVSTFCKFRDADEETQRKYLADLKKDPAITKLDVWGNNFLYEDDLGKSGEHVMLYFNHSMVFVKPTVNSRDGHEYWEIAAASKDVITKFFGELKKHMDIAEIVHVKEEKDIDFAFPLIVNTLTPTQRKIFNLAIELGYYNFPRKADLAKIAKKAGTSIPTVQEHLRKAESKILNDKLIF